MVEEFDINSLIEQDYQEFIDNGVDNNNDTNETTDNEEQGRSKKEHKKRGEGKSYEFFVENDDELMKFLIANLKDKSRTTIKSYLSNRQVSINDVITKQFDEPLKAGDEVKINLGLARKEFRSNMLRIVYEDDYIIIIDKRYGLLTMATEKERIKTAYYILSEYVKSQNSANRIFIVHRLDRDTSGLVMFAKSVEVQHELQKNWNDIVLERKYVAVVEGCPKQDEGLIECYLAENSAYNVYVTKNKEEGELAITGYKVIKKGRDNSLLELELETGKKNQIRVHMQYIGCPIVGDRKYGGKISPIERLCLHASKIRFIHPITHKEMCFETIVPPKFLTILTERKQRSFDDYR